MSSASAPSCCFYAALLTGILKLRRARRRTTIAPSHEPVHQTLGRRSPFRASAAVRFVAAVLAAGYPLTWLGRDGSQDVAASKPPIVGMALPLNVSVKWGCEARESLRQGIELEKWIKAAGLPPQKVELRNVGKGGERGLVASKMLYKGDKLLYIPESLIMTNKSEWTCSEVAKLLKEKDLPDWPLLACYLISEASVGERSRWSKYIAALPRYPSSILQWTAPDVQTHLAATSVKDRAMQCIQDVEETFQDLNSQIFQKHPSTFPSEVYSLDSLKWAFGILFSRLVRLPSLGEALALVPFGDMLNHSTEVETFIDFDSSSKAIICSLDRNYGKDEEVFISYGKRSNGELLVSYGFLPQGKNPANFINLKLSLDPEDQMYQPKLDALKRQGLPEQQTFPVRLTGWPAQLTAFARLLSSPPSERHRYSQLAFEATERSNVKERFQDVDEHVRTLEAILSSCEKSISACNSYLQAKPAAGQPSKEDSQSLPVLARSLCEDELTILYRTQYILRRELKLLKYGPTIGSMGLFDSMFKRK